MGALYAQQAPPGSFRALQEGQAMSRQEQKSYLDDIKASFAQSWVSSTSIIFTALTEFQSKPPSSFIFIFSLDGSNINLKGCSKSKDSCPFLSPFNSWQRPGNALNISKLIAACKSSRRE